MELPTLCADPSRGQLVTRLKELRAAMQAGAYPAQEVEKEAALVIYRALARSLQNPSSRSDLSERQAGSRRQFTKTTLIYRRFWIE